MPANILAFGGLELKSKGVQGFIVSLSNNEVHIYKDKYIVSKFITQDAVIGIKFGKFGREDANLIMTTKSKIFYIQFYDQISNGLIKLFVFFFKLDGGLIIKILKRTAQLAEKSSHGGPPEAQSKKLDIPKKTKLYVDQTTRERDNAICKLIIESFRLNSKLNIILNLYFK